MVGVGNPAREKARLQIAAALMSPRKGRVLAVNVFTVNGQQEFDEELVADYYGTIESRSAALSSVAASIETGRAEIGSHVPVAGSVFYGLLSAQQASQASTVLLGWPEEDAAQDAGRALVELTERYIRAHLMVFREQAPVPADDILAIIDETDHGELALMAAARLATEWGSDLSVGGLVGEGASEEEIAEAEERIEERVGELVKATVRTIASHTLERAESEAEFHDLLIVGVGTTPAADSLCSLIDELRDVDSASVLITRAHQSQPLDQWM